MRLDAIELDTMSGTVRHEFNGPLTVLTGPVGVGKSSLFELVKHAVGGQARIAPVARDSVRAVSVDLQISDTALRLTREIRGDAASVHVFDKSQGVDLGRLPIRPKKGALLGATLSDFLLEKMGLPIDVHWTTSTRSGRITFNNVWSFVYVEQREIDRSIARNNDTWSEPARKTTFELLFGLTDQEVLHLKRDQLVAEEHLQGAEREEAAVRRFLADSRTQTREVAEEIVALEEAQRARARATLDGLQTEAEAARGEIGVVRDLVLQAREKLAGLQEQQRRLELTVEEHQRLRTKLQARSAEVERAREASSILGPIEFVVCPRCAQSIQGRPHADDQCRLCLQPEPVPTELAVRRSRSEVENLRSQEAEVELLVAAAEVDRSKLAAAAGVARQNLIALEESLDERTKYFVSPRLEQYSIAAAELASAEATLSSMEILMRQWDRARDLELVTLEARDSVSAISEAVAGAVERLAAVREQLLAALSDDYQEMVVRLGVPTITSARIDERNYLPIANEDRFDKISTGGITTALVTAYWLTVMATALREGTTDYPSLLIIDTPRKSIGAQNSQMADELYRQLDVLAATYGSNMQVIVADNDIPRDVSRRWETLWFDYANPTISTLAHPGPAQVKTIDSD